MTRSVSPTPDRTSPSTASTAPTGRRVAAGLIDAATFLVLPAALVPLGLWLVSAGVVPSTAAVNLIGLIGVVLPATVWTAGWHAARGATPGQRRFGLSVIMMDSGRRPHLGVALLRAVIKIAVPWELGHTAALGLAAGHAPGVGLWVVVSAAYLLPVITFIGLLRRPHRPLHDRIAHTVVVTDVRA